MCQGEKSHNIWFVLLHIGICHVGRKEHGNISILEAIILGFAPILSKFGNTSPLNLITIFFNLGLGLVIILNGIIRLRRTSPDRSRGIPQKAEAENLNSPGAYRLVVRWFLVVALASLSTSPGA